MEAIRSQPCGNINSSSSIQPVSNIRPKVPYFDMIAEAIVTNHKRKMTLQEIYSYIRHKYPYFAEVNPRGWKSGVRHNLSIHNCFIKVGKNQESKGHYWTVHPASFEDFTRGDFNRKNARQKVHQAKETILKVRQMKAQQAKEAMQNAVIKQMAVQQANKEMQKAAMIWPSTSLCYPQAPVYLQPQTCDQSRGFNISDLLNIK